jgi:phosphatidylserine synthase
MIFAVAPALPLHTAGKYVAGAYIVFLAVVLIYVAIMASRLARTERELTELRRDVELRRQAGEGDAEHGPDRERETVA